MIDASETKTEKTSSVEKEEEQKQVPPQANAGDMGGFVNLPERPSAVQSCPAQPKPEMPQRRWCREDVPRVNVSAELASILAKADNDALPVRLAREAAAADKRKHGIQWQLVVFNAMLLDSELEHEMKNRGRLRMDLEQEPVSSESAILDS